jgi:hypothetical protein
MGNKDQYQQMAEIFGADFDVAEEDKSAVAQTKSRDELVNDLVVKTENEVAVPQEKKILDEDYIKQEYRVGVEMLNDAAEILRSELSAADKPSKWQSFAEIMRERRETLQSLEQSNIQTFERNNEVPTAKNGEAPQQVNNTMIMTSDQMLDMILNAKTGLDPDKEIK